MKRSSSKWKDPGIILVGVLILVAATVLIWWPTDTYVLGISLAGWLMFLSYFVWFGLAVAYVLWIEHLEKEHETEKNIQEKEQKRA